MAYVKIDSLTISPLSSNRPLSFPFVNDRNIVLQYNYNCNQLKVQRLLVTINFSIKKIYLHLLLIKHLNQSILVIIMSATNHTADDQVECPLCMEPLEVDDLNFYPCTCGYQVFIILFKTNILMGFNFSIFFDLFVDLSFLLA